MQVSSGGLSHAPELYRIMYEVLVVRGGVEGLRRAIRMALEAHEDGESLLPGRGWGVDWIGLDKLGGLDGLDGCHAEQRAGCVCGVAAGHAGGPGRAGPPACSEGDKHIAVRRASQHRLQRPAFRAHPNNT